MAVAVSGEIARVVYLEYSSGMVCVVDRFCHAPAMGVYASQ